MNCFQRIIADLHLAQSNSDPANGTLFSILTLASLQYEGADETTNPYRESLRRLELLGLAHSTMRQIRLCFNEKIGRWDRRMNG